MRNYVPKTVRPAPEWALHPLVAAISAAYDVQEEDLTSGNKKRWAACPRQMLYLMAGDLLGWGSSRVAGALNLDAATVQSGRKAARDRIKRDAGEHLRFRRAMRAYIQNSVMGGQAIAANKEG